MSNCPLGPGNVQNNNKDCNCDWTIDQSRNFALKIYSEKEQSAEEIHVEPPNIDQLVIDNLNGTIIKNAVIEPDSYNNNDIKLQLSESNYNIIFDMSGSMTWNDALGFRFDIAKQFINDINCLYNGNVNYNIWTFSSQKVDSNILATSFENSPFNALRLPVSCALSIDEFSNNAENFTGIRIVKNKDRSPTNAIDGEIVFEGIASEFLDQDVDFNETYFYKVFTFNNNFNFSDGIPLNLTLPNSQSPTGVQGFTLQSQSSHTTLIDDNVLSVWHLNEGEGVVAKDFNAKLDLNNSSDEPVWIFDNNAPSGEFFLRFDEVDYLQSIDANNHLELPQVASFFAAVYPFNFDQTRSVISRTSLAGSSIDYEIKINTNGEVEVDLRGTVVTSTSYVSVLSWNFIAVIVDQVSNQIKIYIDGHLDSTSPISLSSLPSDDYYFSIGYSEVTSNSFFGYIDEVSVHNIDRPIDYIFERSQFDNVNNIVSGVDFLLNFNYIIPENFDFESGKVVVVEQVLREPNHIDDGKVIYEADASSGEFNFTYRTDFNIGVEYFYKIFSVNVDGEPSQVSDSQTFSFFPSLSSDRNYQFDDIDINMPILSGKAGVNKNLLEWNMPNDNVARVELNFFVDEPNLQRVTSEEVSDLIDESVLSQIKFTKSTFDLNEDTLWSLTLPSDQTKHLHANLPNNVFFYYVLIFYDRYGRQYLSDRIALRPTANNEDNFAPNDVLNLTYFLLDDSIKFQWVKPFGVFYYESFFDENTVVYNQISNTRGRPIPQNSTQYSVKNNISIDRAVNEAVPDIFLNQLSFIPFVTDALFFDATSKVDSQGLVKTWIQPASDRSRFKNYESVSLENVFDVEIDSIDDKLFPLSKAWLYYRNPLNITITNRFNDVVEVESLNQPVSGTYVRSSTNVSFRVILKWKDGTVPGSAVVQAAIVEAVGDLALGTPDIGGFSQNVNFVNPNFDVQTKEIEILDDFCNKTGETETISFVDLELQTPPTPENVWLFVKINFAGFTIVKRVLVVYKNILKINLFPALPVVNTVDVREQIASAYIIDPDFPDDITKRQQLSDGTIAKWSAGSSIDQIPFYSTSDLDQSQIVQSSFQNGVASEVFLGPLFFDTAIEQIDLSVEASYDGLVAQDSAVLEVINPLNNTEANEINNVVFFSELSNDKVFVYGDGVDYVKLTIWNDINDASSRYADCFRQRAADNQITIGKLQPGGFIDIKASNPDVEIIYGDVLEEFNSSTGETELIFNSNNVAFEQAQVEITDPLKTEVFFRYKNDSDLNSEGYFTQNNCFRSSFVDVYSKEICLSMQSQVIVNNESFVATSGSGSANDGSIACSSQSLFPMSMIFIPPLSVRMIERRVNGVSTNSFSLEPGDVNALVFEPLFKEQPVDKNFVSFEAFLIDVEAGKMSLLANQISLVDEVIDGETKQVAVVTFNEIKDFFFSAELDIVVTYFDFSKKVSYNIIKDDSVSNSLISISKKFDAFDVVLLSSSTLQDMNRERSFFVSQNFNSDIYAIGGLSSTTILDDVEKYDILLDEWINVSSMNHARFGHMSVTVDGQIYVMGGIQLINDRFQVSRKLERYDVSSDTWTKLSDMPTLSFSDVVNEEYYGVAFGQAVLVEQSSKQYIYIVSGVRDVTKDGKFYYPNDRVVYYDIDADEWHVSDIIESSLFNRVFPQIYNDNSQVIVFGGASIDINNNELVLLGDAYALDVNTFDVLVASGELSQVPLPRLGVASATIQDSVYLFGGLRNAFVNDFEAVDFSVTPGAFSEIPNFISQNKAFSSGEVLDSQNISFLGGKQSVRKNNFVFISASDDSLNLSNFQQAGVVLSAFDVQGNPIQDYLDVFVDVNVSSDPSIPVIFENKNLTLIDSKSVVLFKNRSLDLPDNYVIQGQVYVNDPNLVSSLFQENLRESPIISENSLILPFNSYNLQNIQSVVNDSDFFVNSIVDTRDVYLPVVEKRNDFALNYIQADHLIDTISQEQSIGYSPLFSAINETGLFLQKNREFDNLDRKILVFTDNDENLSSVSQDNAIKRVNNLKNSFEDFIPVSILSLSLGKDPIEGGYRNQSETFYLNEISHETKGQAIDVLSTDFKQQYVNFIIGNSFNSIGNGQAEFVYSFDEIVKIKDVVVNFDLNEFSSGRWKMYAGDSLNDLELVVSDGDPNDVECFHQFYAKVLKFKFDLFSFLGYAESSICYVADLPVVKNIVINFVKQKTDYVYSNKDTTLEAAREVAVGLKSNFGLEKENQVRVGFSNSQSSQFQFYDLPSQPAVVGGGKVIVPNRRDFIKINGELIAVETLTTNDNIVYKLEYGPWEPCATIRVMTESGIVIDDSSYVTIPEKGLIVFNTYQPGENLISHMIYPDVHKVGFEIKNFDENSNNKIYGLGKISKLNRH